MSLVVLENLQNLDKMSPTLHGPHRSGSAELDSCKAGFPKIPAIQETVWKLLSPNPKMRGNAIILSSAECTLSKIPKVPQLWWGSCVGVRFADIIYIGQWDFRFCSGISRSAPTHARNVSKIRVRVRNRTHPRANNPFNSGRL